MKYLVIMLFVLGSLSLSAQHLPVSEKANINERISAYFERTKANAYMDMMDYVYPKVFTLATKVQLVEVFNGLETMGLGLNVEAIALNKIDPLMEEGDKEFAIADYSIEIKLELLSETMQSEQVVESLKSSFKVSYNATNMVYDEESKTLSFDGQKYLLAIKDPEYDANDWYFLEYDAGNPMALQMLVSNGVMEKFKEKMGL